MLDFPTKRVLRRLMKMAESTPDDQIYAMTITGTANMARNLAPVNPAFSDSITLWIVEQISDSISENRLPFFINALGNTGSYKAFRLLKNYAHTAPPNIRAAVASSLSWIDSTSADTLLARLLTSDPDSYVRIQTAYTLNRRTPIQLTLQAQERVLSEEESIIVRMTVLRNFSEVLDDFPYLEDLIREVARTDPSEDVQKEARRILKSFEG